MAVRRSPLSFARALALALALTLGLLLAGCGGGDSEITAGQQSDEGESGVESSSQSGDAPLPEAVFANTAAEYCDGVRSSNNGGSEIEMAFNATVTAVEFRPTIAREGEGGDGPGSETVPWITFEIHTWYTADLGSTMGLWGLDFDGAVGERWLIASSRYTVASDPSGDVYPCASVRETPEHLEEWAAEYQGGVTPGAGRAETEADPELLAAIDEAEAKWIANGPPTYTVNIGFYSRADGFGDCGSDRVRLVVEAGEVIQARDLNRHCDLPVADTVTIEQAFDLARSAAGAIQEGPEFDEQYGFIQYFYAADRSVEIGLDAYNLRTTAYPLADSRQPALDAARSLWEAANIGDYTWTVETVCFCDVPGPIEISVEGGSIVDTSIQAESFYLVTVDELFDVIEANIDGDHIEVAYHPELGFPVEVHLDPDVDTSDDETSYFTGTPTAS